MDRRPQQMLAILFSPFVFFLPKILKLFDFVIFWLWAGALSIHDEVCSRNASQCALNLISTYFFQYWFFFGSIHQDVSQNLPIPTSVVFYVCTSICRWIQFLFPFIFLMYVYQFVDGSNSPVIWLQKIFQFNFPTVNWLWIIKSMLI